MGTFRCRMFFGVGGYGWTEDVFLLRPTAQEALASLQRLAVERAKLLPDDYVIGHLSVSNVAVLGDSLVVALPDQVQRNGTALPFRGVTVRLHAKQVLGGKTFWVGRSYCLRGLGEGKLPEGQLNAYLTALVREQAHLGVYDRSAKTYPVESVWPSGCPDRIDVWLSEAVLVPQLDPITGDNAKVTIKGAQWKRGRKGPDPLAGVRWVLESSPGVISVAGEDFDGSYYQAGGVVQLREVVYLPVERWLVRGIRVRKTGRGAEPNQRFATSGSELPRSGPGGFLRGVKPPNPSVKQSDLEPQIPVKPVVKTLRNAQDLVQHVYTDYDLGPISINEVLNFENTYLVCCSGTYNDVGQATDIYEAIYTAYHDNGLFTKYLWERVTKKVPKGNTLIFAGHSLGGMVPQWVLHQLLNQPWDVHSVITFGSPQVNAERDGVRYKRFKIKGDGVTALGPLGPLLILKERAPQIELALDVPNGIVVSHTTYTVNKDLLAYDALGQYFPGGGVELELGETVYYDAPKPWAIKPPLGVPSP